MLSKDSSRIDRSKVIKLKDTIFVDTSKLQSDKAYFGNVFVIVFYRLTKAEQEHHQKVVKAEIVTYPQNRISSNPQSTVKTSVCALQ